MRKIDLIVVHCTATPAGRDVSISDVDRWHRQRGFSSVGYHYLVRLNGLVELGRPLSSVGAHCKGHNCHSIGVAYVGGLDADGMNAKDTRTEAQKRSLCDLIAQLKRRFPAAIVRGHCDYAAKACPCFNAMEEYSQL